MSRVQELISVLAEKDVIARDSFAKADRICKICGEPAIHFKTSRAELEYSLSSICQSCQDYYFPQEQWANFTNSLRTQCYHPCNHSGRHNIWQLRETRYPSGFDWYWADTYWQPLALPLAPIYQARSASWVLPFWGPSTSIIFRAQVLYGVKIQPYMFIYRL